MAKRRMSIRRFKMKMRIEANKRNEVETKAIETYKEGRHGDALTILLPLAEEGSMLAQYFVGLSYYEGNGNVVCFETAAIWFRKSAEQGHRLSKAFIASVLLYSEGNDSATNLEEGIRWCIDAAMEGHLWCIKELARRYMSGDGVAKDVTESLKFYARLAMKDDAAAQAILGYHYSVGEGVPQNFKLAYEWTVKAAQEGSANALSLLGVIFERGEHVRSSEFTAFVLYNLAASRGSKCSVDNRDKVMKALTKKQIAECQQIAVEWSVGTPLPIPVTGVTIAMRQKGMV